MIKKKEVRTELRKRRKKGEEDKKYKRSKQENKDLCEKRKREENARWKRKAVEVRREEEVWKIVNRERRKRRRINEDIGWEEEGTL